jgi:hypothetical protein
MAFFGLLGKRRPAAAEIDNWEPVSSPAELEGDPADMEDDGQVSDVAYFAYRVDHELASVPGAHVAVWTYVAYGEGDSFVLGLRYQFTTGEDPAWSYTGYAEDLEREEFATLDLADAGAQEWADAIARPGGKWQKLLDDEVFDWDGHPFADDDEED